MDAFFKQNSFTLTNKNKRGKKHRQRTDSQGVTSVLVCPHLFLFYFMLSLILVGFYSSFWALFMLVSNSVSLLSVLGIALIDHLSS